MAVTNTETDALKTNLEKAQEDLKLLYLNLGRAAAPWHRAIAYSPSQEAFEHLCTAAEEKAAIDQEIESVNTALSNVSNSDTEIKKAKLSLSDLDNRLEVLKSSIGAVAVETQKAGKLPEELNQYLKNVQEFNTREAQLEKQKQEAKGLAKALVNSRIKHLSKDMNEVFTHVGQAIFNSGKANLLPSEKAHALVGEMQEILHMKEVYTNNLKNQKETIDKAMGVLGAENTRLKDLQAKERELNQTLNEMFTNYGELLAGGMDIWLDDMAPEELKTPCRQIKEQKKHVRELMLNIKLLSSEKEIEMHQAKTEQLAAQLSHINSQLALIEKQKTDIQIKLQEEQKAIMELKNKQDSINSLF